MKTQKEQREITLKLIAKMKKDRPQELKNYEEFRKSETWKKLSQEKKDAKEAWAQFYFGNGLEMFEMFIKGCEIEEEYLRNKLITDN